MTMQHHSIRSFAVERVHMSSSISYFFSIVYDPVAKDNEAQSAAVLREFSKETTLDSSSYVANLIEGSASHCTEAHMDPSSYGSDDSHYFLDFDMAILGADAEDYDQYRKEIREEYNHLDATTYAQERSKVLRMFLQIPNIYATKEFRESYEAKARANIQREIDLLGAPSS
uniref:Uncharacterized protein n=1 Tax=Plectus sambesii TaxID=2011161 RepID=A0A914VBA9_9BILA